MNEHWMEWLRDVFRRLSPAGATPLLAALDGLTSSDQVMLAEAMQNRLDDAVEDRIDEGNYC